jgi:hypothetical protein
MLLWTAVTAKEFKGGRRRRYGRVHSIGCDGNLKTPVSVTSSTSSMKWQTAKEINGLAKKHPGVCLGGRLGRLLVPGIDRMEYKWNTTRASISIEYYWRATRLFS